MARTHPVEETPKDIPPRAGELAATGALPVRRCAIAKTKLLQKLILAFPADPQVDVACGPACWDARLPTLRRRRHAGGTGICFPQRSGHRMDLRKDGWPLRVMGLPTASAGDGLGMGRLQNTPKYVGSRATIGQLEPTSLEPKTIILRIGLLPPPPGPPRYNKLRWAARVASADSWAAGKRAEGRFRLTGGGQSGGRGGS